MYAVVGATGNTGRAAVQELESLGEKPVCVVRNADKARAVLCADAKVAVAELDDRAGMTKALTGTKRVFIATGGGPSSTAQQINVIEAAKAAGAEYIVKLSGARAVIGPSAPWPNNRAHFEIEEHLKRSGLQWCILSPGFFMQNILGQAANIKQGKIAQPWPKDLAVALIDVRDVAALGARALRHPGKHAGNVYSFTGAATTYGEFANVIGEVLGKPITYLALTLEQAKQGMKARGIADGFVADLVAMAGALSKENTQPIRDIVGRAPITIRQFAQDYRDAFR
jgi:NAD(P)H dehydrogenase (quinone)